MEDVPPCSPENARSDLLSDSQHVAIDALIGGATRAAAAKAAGVDPKTLFRWFLAPEFRSHLRRCREAANALAMARAASMREHMLRNIETLAFDPKHPAKVRLQASAEYLEHIRRSEHDEAKAGTPEQKSAPPPAIVFRLRQEPPRDDGGA